MTAPATLARVERACAELLADSLPVTFAAVAAKAALSRATLYRDESLRAVVEEHRQASRDPRSLSGGFVNSTWPHRDRLIWPHQWDTFAKSLVPGGHFGWCRGLEAE